MYSCNRVWQNRAFAFQQTCRVLCEIHAGYLSAQTWKAFLETSTIYQTRSTFEVICYILGLLSHSLLNSLSNTSDRHRSVDEEQHYSEYAVKRRFQNPWVSLKYSYSGNFRYLGSLRKSNQIGPWMETNDTSSIGKLHLVRTANWCKESRQWPALFE